MSESSRVGLGIDFHRLREDEELILGGEEIDSPLGTVAHSDGDVLVHALIDALLGALGEGDIGEFFPDNDPEYEDARSLNLLQEIYRKVQNSDLVVENVDATLILEEPKLNLYKGRMEKNISDLLSAEANLKATTAEGTLFKGEGIAAQVVVLLAEGPG